MAKEVRWSVKADRERIQIFDYWLKRNGSATYSIKLSKLFTLVTQQIAKHPESGKPTELSLIRIKIVSNYLIYYKINGDFVDILTVWDSRRNPKKIKL